MLPYILIKTYVTEMLTYFSYRKLRGGKVHSTAKVRREQNVENVCINVYNLHNLNIEREVCFYI